jgi:hypothetical protein
MKTLNFKRLMHFLLFDTAAQKSELLRMLVVFPAIYVVRCVLVLLWGGSVDQWAGGYFEVSAALCILTGLFAFRNENHPTRAMFYLTMPVSHCERFTSRWVSSFSLIFFGNLLIFLVLSNVFVEVSALLGRSPRQMVYPEIQQLLSSFGIFLLAHSISFAGGIFFKRSPGIKTALSAILYAGVLSIGALVLVVGGVAQKAAFDLSRIGQLDGVKGSFDTTTTVLMIAWQLIFPILLYVAAYFRTIENEARG